MLVIYILKKIKTLLVDVLQYFISIKLKIVQIHYKRESMHYGLKSLTQDLSFPYIKIVQNFKKLSRHL